MSTPEERPLSVAELLARNGTIGSPPVGGRRRRKRRNDEGVSVAELTGEIPVIRTGDIPVVSGDEYVEYEYGEDEYEYVEDEVDYEGGYGEEESADEAAAGDYATAEYVEYVEYVEYSPADPAAEYSDQDGVGASDYPADAEAAVPESSEMVIVYTPAEPPAPAAEAVAQEQPVPAVEAVAHETAEFAAPVEEPVAPPPHSSDPVPHRGRGPELSHDPRPQRRSSDAEQMAYDPVDESVSLADLVEEHVDPEQLRSYLRASEGTLFSGGTVADDLARRGFAAEAGDVAEAEDHEYEYDEDLEEDAVSRRPRGPADALGSGLVAILQSLLAVAFGAGLFVAFDQLWRWNTLVALVLTVLVVVALAGAVRMLRRTEDIVSTLTAVAVGLLVTLGPLALQN